ncbi:MAG: hypothetical protein JWM74_5706 [Myxococcaceae bacterium]|nr:hypothetical protein [Myxococcaceae bacterium]
MKVVAHRVDWLTLGYRVEIDDALISHLKERHAAARKHGRVAVAYNDGPDDSFLFAGELGFSRADKCWNVSGPRYRVRIDLKAPGAVGARGSVGFEPGWTVEISWSAQALAALGDVDAAVAESHQLMKSIGAVFESRLRRIDLCADVAGKAVDGDDVQRLVRRSRAKVTTHVKPEGLQVERVEVVKVEVVPASVGGGKTKEQILCDVAACASLHGRKKATGITVGAGGAVMGRIYDKRTELEQSAHRKDEEERWREGGWSGADDEPVTRVEYQVRGTAIREFGLRDPDNAVDPASGLPLGVKLGDRIDALWQACLSWMKLVNRDSATRRSRCREDALWGLLRAVVFKHEATNARRFRVRGGASLDQLLGCALSILGVRQELEQLELRFDEGSELLTADEMLVVHVDRIVDGMRGKVADHLRKRWGGPLEAVEHIAEIQNAARARFLQKPKPPDTPTVAAA